jgi:hypothetical protein
LGLTLEGRSSVISDAGADFARDLVRNGADVIALVGRCSVERYVSIDPQLLSGN